MVFIARCALVPGCIVPEGTVCTAQVGLSSGTVLTLDDDSSMRSIVREMLKGCGYRNVLSTGDGRVALPMLHEHRLRLVLSVIAPSRLIE